MAAAGGDLLQRAHGAKALGLAGRLIDGPPEATALFDFPYAGSTGASCSSTELATGDGPRGTGPVPGRSPIITASFLAFPGRGSYRRICRALFGSASDNRCPSASRWTPQTYTLCSTTKGRLSQRTDFASTRIQATASSSAAPYGRIGVKDRRLFGLPKYVLIRGSQFSRLEHGT